MRLVILDDPEGFENLVTVVDVFLAPADGFGHAAGAALLPELLDPVAGLGEHFGGGDPAGQIDLAHGAFSP